jgi:membrane protein required for colicin V production
LVPKVNFAFMALPDIILGGFLLYGFLRGIWKGLFTELASLVALLAGIYIAVKFSGFAGSVIAGYVSWQPKYITIAAFVITFIAVVVGIILLGKFFTKLAGFASLGWLNRILGGVFGLLKWVLILSVSLQFFLKLNKNNAFAKESTLKNSFFFYPVLEVSNTIYPALEEWFADFKSEGYQPEQQEE